jgi:hypothetical protein
MLIPSIYRHEQSTAATEWTIVHNLGTNGGQGVPVVDVFVNINGTLTKILPNMIEAPNYNTVVIEFDGGAFAGIAIIIV